MEETNKPKIYLGLDISLKCIGCCLMACSENNETKVLKLAHILPKVNDDNQTKALFERKRAFEDDFLIPLKEFNIEKVIIEEPMLSTTNKDMVSSLLRFNGMITDSIYSVLDLFPEYITSYQARQYAFPDLLSIRKYCRDGSLREKQNILDSINDNQIYLFGEYTRDIDKKEIIWNRVSDMYPDIQWVKDKNGNLKKENFDACDALVCILATLNKERFGEGKIITKLISNTPNKIEYTVSLWDRTFEKSISF